MTAVSLVDVVTNVSASLIGAPDQVSFDGRPFIAERIQVHKWQGRVIAGISGRAIRVDGSLGTSTRYVSYDLVGSEPAPGWLVAALRCAGVTW